MGTSHEFYHNMASHIHVEREDNEEGISVSVALTETKCRRNENLSRILSPSDISHLHRERKMSRA